MTENQVELSSPETAAAVLAYVADNPRASLRAIGEAVGIGQSTAHRAIGRLVRAGDVRVERMGSSKGYPSLYSLSDVMTPDTVSDVPNTPGTPRRTIRIPDALWDAAAAKAAERGENLSDVIRKALERYARRTK